MAKNIKRCWGIDIGQCAIKALRCTLEGDQIVADAFDYIEYPKILSQPEAEPEQLVKEALETFLSRNEISRRDDKVAISVPGQSGLTKFFKPPPVDVKRLPDICRFRSQTADSVSTRGSDLGLPAVAGRAGDRWLCNRYGSRPVRDETRSGTSSVTPVQYRGHPVGLGPIGTNLDL